MKTLLYIIQQYTLYFGYFLFIAGILGNIMNIYILSAVKSYRSTPCTFHFLTASVYNIIIILVGLISRIIETGYGLDLSTSSVIWCKIRQYFIMSIPIIPFYCQCLATIDQFFVTSRNVRLREFSKIKQAYWNSIGLSIICLLHGIPFFVYYDISPSTNLCSSANVALNLYIPIFILGICLFIPTSVIVLFGFMTYRNITRSVGLNNIHADRQLAIMVCMQVILIILTTIPYGIFNIYSLSTIRIVKDEDRLSKELLGFTIVSLNTYIYTGGSFYVFIASSSRFRQMVKKRIIFWRRSNQVSPQ